MRSFKAGNSRSFIGQRIFWFSNDCFWRISLKKSLNRSFWGRGRRISEKSAMSGGPVIRIASGEPGIKRDSGDELCQFPQILGGRCKQEFIASTACSSQPQSSEPQDPLEMRK